jgi:hypothetical protein
LCIAFFPCRYPTTDEEQQALFAQSVFPEKVVVLRVSSEQYVRRRVEGEWRRRRVERLRRPKASSLREIGGSLKHKCVVRLA